MTKTYEVLRHPDSKGDYWLVENARGGQTPLAHLGKKQPPPIVQALPDIWEALEEADTAFVCLNICDDLTPQARGALRSAWAMIQAARAKARPNGAYADAVKDPDTAYMHEQRERDAFRSVVHELGNWHTWALQFRPDYPNSDGAKECQGKLDAARAILNGKPREQTPPVLACLKRIVPWLGKMIANGGHKESVAPLDAENALRQAEDIIQKANRLR